MFKEVKILSISKILPAGTSIHTFSYDKMASINEKIIYYSWLFYTDKLADIQYTLDSPSQRHLDFINEMGIVQYNYLVVTLQHTEMDLVRSIP